MYRSYTPTCYDVVFSFFTPRCPNVRYFYGHIVPEINYYIIFYSVHSLTVAYTAVGCKCLCFPLLSLSDRIVSNQSSLLDRRIHVRRGLSLPCLPSSIHSTVRSRVS